MALKLKFPNLRTGDIVRVRSALVDETSSLKKVLNMSHFSNILTFPASSKLAKELKGKISDDKPEKVGKGKVQMNAVIISEIDKKHAHLKNTPLSELFH